MYKFLKSLIINDLHVFRTILRRNQSMYENLEACWVDTPRDLIDPNIFQSWFDTAESEASSIDQAEYDFNHRIIEMARNHISSDLSRAVSCEIGFGGGRLLMQAAKNFNFAYGVDIHDGFSGVEDFLARYRVSNFKLIKSDQKDELLNKKIDLIYSFIVIQHFRNLDVLSQYLDFIKNTLSKDGSAVLWYARLTSPFFGNFYEVPDVKFKKRESSLFIRPKYMEELCLRKGFKILDHRYFPKKYERFCAEVSAQSVIVLSL